MADQEGLSEKMVLGACLKKTWFSTDIHFHNHQLALFSHI